MARRSRFLDRPWPSWVFAGKPLSQVDDLADNKDSRALRMSSTICNIAECGLYDNLLWSGSTLDESDRFTGTAPGNYELTSDSHTILNSHQDH